MFYKSKFDGGSSLLSVGDFGLRFTVGAMTFLMERMYAVVLVKIEVEILNRHFF